MVPATAAQVAAPVQVRVDDQPAPKIVAAGNLERIGIPIDKPICAGHLDLLAVDDLVYVGRIVHDLTPVARQADVQGAGIIDFQAVDAAVAYLYLRKVGAGVDVELILEVIAPAPGVQVDTVVETLVGHNLIGWYVLTPLVLVAEKEVESALRRLETHRDHGVCPIKRGREANALHLGRLSVGSAVRHIGRDGGVFVARHFAEQFEDRPIVGVSDVCALPLVDETDATLPLSLVLDEHRRRSVKQLDGLPCRHAVQKQARLQRL